MPPFKTLSTGLAVVALGAGLAASTPAAADPGAVIAGVIGGAAVGAIIAGAASQPRYSAPYTGYYPAAPAYRAAPVYDVAPAAQPVYDEDEVVYAPRCRVVQRPVYDDWGRLAGYRPSRRCR
ncbi:MAG: hypothetical protein KDJ25_02045 [Rhodoblastus sp.]|nr:hypothetical protein [Rhodoblastus sp.]